jgi:hypothetical protein
MATTRVFRLPTNTQINSLLTQASASTTYLRIAAPMSTKTSSYTIGSSGISDNGSIIQMNGSSTNNVIVPVDGTNGVTFPNGSQITIVQTSAVQTTVQASGTTINSTPGLRLRTQWSSATLIKRSANTWMLLGDLSV